MKDGAHHKWSDTGASTFLEGDEGAGPKGAGDGGGKVATEVVAKEVWKVVVVGVKEKQTP